MAGIKKWVQVTVSIFKKNSDFNKIECFVSPDSFGDTTRGKLLVPTCCGSFLKYSVIFIANAVNCLCSS